MAVIDFNLINPDYECLLVPLRMNCGWVKGFRFVVALWFGVDVLDGLAISSRSRDRLAGMVEEACQSATPALWPL